MIREGLPCERRQIAAQLRFPGGCAGCGATRSGAFGRSLDRGCGGHADALLPHIVAKFRHLRVYSGEVRLPPTVTGSHFFLFPPMIVILSLLLLPAERFRRPHAWHLCTRPHVPGPFAPYGAFASGRI